VRRSQRLHRLVLCQDSFSNKHVRREVTPHDTVGADVNRSFTFDSQRGLSQPVRQRLLIDGSQEVWPQPATYLHGAANGCFSQSFVFPGRGE
jgi:hypothetical protein